MTTMKLERIPSMRERVEDTLSAYRNDLVSLLSRSRLFSPIDFCRAGMLQPHHLVDALATLGDDGRTKLSEGPFSEVLRSAQVRMETVLFNELERPDDRYMLELDFEPFNASFPRPNRSSSIGNGVLFLNRHLSSIMFRNKDCLEPLLDFLRAHKYKGHVRVAIDEYLGALTFHSYIAFPFQIVYILDQVRALENEMLLRIKKQGLDIDPKILIVSES
ncbi:hypothetical protein B296_00021287 [Ensete ventricosum]|uniref:sucrose synthase n=1 Tax=Ensete ventricosum TaxID=4639 RepID=A0A427AUC2_ENSVE|nr:hypothetical protein B296_00021287 [Ensete ventricosum]